MRTEGSAGEGLRDLRAHAREETQQGLVLGTGPYLCTSCHHGRDTSCPQDEDTLAGFIQSTKYWLSVCSAAPLRYKQARPHPAHREDGIVGGESTHSTVHERE